MERVIQIPGGELALAAVTPRTGSNGYRQLSVNTHGWEQCMLLLSETQFQIDVNMGEASDKFLLHFSQENAAWNYKTELW